MESPSYPILACQDAVQNIHMAFDCETFAVRVSNVTIVCVEPLRVQVHRKCPTTLGGKGPKIIDSVGY